MFNLCSLISNMRNNCLFTTYYVVLKILNTYSISYVLLIKNGSFRRYKPRRSEVLISFYLFSPKNQQDARKRNPQNLYLRTGTRNNNNQNRTLTRGRK